MGPLHYAAIYYTTFHPPLSSAFPLLFSNSVLFFCIFHFFAQNAQKTLDGQSVFCYTYSVIYFIWKGASIIYEIY